jgi:hypothetical protein
MQAIKIKVNFPFTLPSNMLLYPKDKDLRNDSLGQSNGPAVQDSLSPTVIAKVLLGIAWLPSMALA